MLKNYTPEMLQQIRRTLIALGFNQEAVALETKLQEIQTTAENALQPWVNYHNALHWVEYYIQQGEACPQTPDQIRQAVAAYLTLHQQALQDQAQAGGRTFYFDLSNFMPPGTPAPHAHALVHLARQFIHDNAVEGQQLFDRVQFYQNGQPLSLVVQVSATEFEIDGVRARIAGEGQPQATTGPAPVQPEPLAQPTAPAVPQPERPRFLTLRGGIRVPVTERPVG